MGNQGLSHMKKIETSEPFRHQKIWKNQNPDQGASFKQIVEDQTQPGIEGGCGDIKTILMGDILQILIVGSLQY